MKTILLVFLLIILLFSLVLIGVGVYGIIEKKIFRFDIPIWVSISLASVGGILFLFCFLMFVLELFKSPCSYIQPRDAMPELELFLIMIHSSEYNENEKKYKGNNYRDNGELYAKLFQPELKNKPKLYLKEDQEFRDDFSDKRLVLIWKLFDEYMKDRFDINKAVRNIIKYNKFLSCVKYSDLPSIFDALYILRFYKSVFKLMNRGFLNEKIAIRLMKNLKITVQMFLRFKVLANINGEGRNAEYDVPISLFYDALKTNDDSMIKEYNRRDYHPVLVLYREGIGKSYTESRLNLSVSNFLLSPMLEKMKISYGAIEN